MVPAENVLMVVTVRLSEVTAEADSVCDGTADAVDTAVTVAAAVELDVQEGGKLVPRLLQCVPGQGHGKGRATPPVQ